MTLLLAALPLFLATATPSPDGGQTVTAVSVDGGEVPIVAPSLTPLAARVLAPELVPDGGSAPIIAPVSLSVYSVDLPAEAAITAGTFGLYFMADILIKPTLPGAVPLSEADRMRLSAFDRYAVGKVSVPWQTFSDVALASLIVVPALYLGIESLALPTQSPWGDFATDLLVVSESLALTACMQTILKFAFRRPRPALYDPSNTDLPFDNGLSLPSGHVSMVSAATTALTTTIFLRHPESKMRWVVLAGGLALSILTGIARVESGQHFPTDSITGLMIGGFAGFAVPYLHRKQSRITPTVAFNPATGTTMFAISGAL